MQKLSLFVLLLYFQNTTFAQRQHKADVGKQNAPFEWGKIAQEDLDMTVYSLDKNVDAVILDSYGSIGVVDAYDYESFLKVHKRIKILNESAFQSQSTVKIRFHSNYKYLEKFENIRAKIIYKSGIVKTLNKSDFEEVRIDDFFSDKVINFKNLETGCILEYEYELRSSFRWRLHDWFLQDEIPCRHSDVKITVPKRYGFVWGKRGEDSIKDLEHKDTFSEGTYCSFLHFASDSLYGLKPDTFMTSINSYLTSLYFQVSEIGYQGEVTDHLKDWKEFASYVQLNYETYALPHLLNNVPWFQINDKINALTNDSLKAELIHEFVKSKMTWDKSKWFVPQSSVSDAFKQKKGNSADINILLYALLKRAGINVYPVILGTRSSSNPMEKYPVLNQFNYVICYCIINGKSVFLDATDPFFTFNIIQPDALNNRGLLLDKDKTRWIDIVASGGSIQRIIDFELVVDKGISGDINSFYKGYDALNERHSAVSVEEMEKATKKYYTKLAPDITMDGFSKTNLRELNEPYKTNVHFKLPNTAGSAGNVFYINPTLFADYRESPFKQKDRSYPVDIPYKQSRNYIVTFKIPPGYEVVDLPKNIKLSLPDNAATFQYFISNTGNLIQVSVKLNINRLQYAADNYSPLKNFFDQVAAKENEQVVLKKK